MRSQKLQLDSILRFFGLSACSGYRRLGGWANQNYLVWLPDSQQYVVKYLIAQRTVMLENDIAIQGQLRGAGISAPSYLESLNGSHIYVDEKVTAVVSPKLIGIHPRQLNKAFCFEIGKVAAAFHTVVHSLPRSHCGWLNTASAERFVEFPSNLPHVRAAQSLIAGNRFIYGLDLPTGIIHGDLHENNVLIEAQAAPRITTVMDFEESERNLLVVDLARTIISVCRDECGTALIGAKIDAVVQGYASGRRLEKSEEAALPNVIKYALGIDVIWLHEHGFDLEAREHLERSHKAACDWQSHVA
jgi:Ser/Thr protein kinase RdoA (MazF antagonist)